MTTPTREQVQAWGKQAQDYAESQTSDPHDIPEIMTERFAELACEAARAQALDEAVGLCEGVADEHRRTESRKYPEPKTDAESGATKCQGAIEQLKAKP